MRIGMVLDLPFPPDLRVENEALSLIKQGHHIVLFTPNYTNLPFHENYKGIEVVRFKAGRLTYKLSALAYDLPLYRLLLFRKIRNLIRYYKVDVLHIHDMVIAGAVLHANKPLGLPVVLDLHENRPEIMKEYKHVNTLPGKLLIRLARWNKKYYELADQSDKVIVVTDSAKEDIILKSNKNDEDIVVVPNSVNLESFQNHAIDSKISERMKGYFNILYLGDTSLRRGTDTAIRAVKLLQNSIPNIKLWLVGKSSADGYLKQLAVSLDVDRFVAFEGWQDSALFPSYIQGSSVCLSPLKRNLHHDTTYANKLFQYMSYASPLVVSDCNAQADLIRTIGCGLVHRAGDEKDLATKILDMFNNPSRSKEMASLGKEAVLGQWNWDKTISPLLEMYAKLNRAS